jgi:cell division septal protein FtsQ
LTRLSHFVKVYPKIIGERAAQVEYIDLRYQDGLAIRWKTIT